jgi:FKBP-type peptidyl-prolyl cis-trans isomerase (trigger factor)
VGSWFESKAAHHYFNSARVAELADALDLGSSSRKGVWVRLPPLAPSYKKRERAVNNVKQIHPTINDSQSLTTNEDGIFSSGQTNFKFQLHEETSQLFYATVIMPASLIDRLYHETARLMQQTVHAPGFGHGNVPVAYIQENFHANLTNHLKEFLFKYAVLNFIFKQLRTQKLPVAGEPRLMSIELAPRMDARFTFELTMIPALNIPEWKYLPFKAPKRKNYKDLDRQVESFISQEREHLAQFQDSGIAFGDWVLFSLALTDHNNSPLMDKELFWFKVSDEEGEHSLRSLFLGKKPGNQEYSSNKGLQEYLSNHLDTHYNFHLEIIDTLPHSFFCFELFKRHFKAKTNKDLAKKLIEVFSYRNDISQRRSMVEESLKLLLSKNYFAIPQHLILREQKSLLEAVRENPDYNVYRVQKDFQQRLRQLAEKHAREKIFIDHLAYTENIAITDHDIKAYLNLTIRQRTKEFIYFEHPQPMIEGHEIPIASEEIKRICLREKTINYAIHHLTKK